MMSNNASTEEDLREVAATLSKTSRVLGQGLEQANVRGQKLRGAIARLERSSEWSLAERRRAEDEISGFFDDMREAMKVKEDELLRDAKAVYDLQDENNKRRLEELVSQGQRLSKACQAIQGLQDGTVKASIDSLNPLLNQLLEALEASSLTLQREETLQESEALNLGNDEEKGVKFILCPDRQIQDQISKVALNKFDHMTPPLVLVGTPEAIELETSKRNISIQESPKRITNQVSNKNSFTVDEYAPVVGSTTPKSSFSERPTATLNKPREFEASHYIPSPSRNGTSNTGSTKKSVNNPMKVKAVIPFDGEDKGVVYYFGTKCSNRVEFSNPALFSPDDANLMVLRASSRIEGDLASLVGYTHHDGTFFETDSLLSSWVSVELPYPLAPSHYSLGYYINGQDHVPRNWVLQASDNNVQWTTLKVHENDSSLDSEMHLNTWRIADQANNNKGPYKFFRIMQTGPTSTGTMFLVLSFIEFYGTLFENE